MKLSVVMVLLGVSEAFFFGTLKTHLKRLGDAKYLQKVNPEGTNDVLDWTEKIDLVSNDWRLKAGEQLAREGKQGEELGMYLSRLEGVSPNDKWYREIARNDVSNLQNGPLSDYLTVFDSLVRNSWLKPNTEDYSGALLDVLSMGKEQFETELNYARGGGGDGEY